jgi:membrane-associated phospholipid phosphatase
MNEKVKFAIITGITIIVIILEITFRDELLEYSNKLTTHIVKHSTEVKDVIVNIITKLGTFPGFIPITFILILFFPMTISTTFLFTFSIGSYINNLLKIIYSEPRPFWIHPELLKNCSSGYGNPSGHSLESTLVYLSIWNILERRNFFLKNKILKYFFLFFILWLIITIMLTRLYLAAHSLNQVILGMALGFYIYYTVYVYFDLPNISVEKYFSFFDNKITVLKVSTFFLTLMIILIISFYARNPDTSLYDIVLDNICPELNDNNRFSSESLHKGFLMFISFGTYYGIAYCLNRMDNIIDLKTLNEWNTKLNIKEVCILAMFTIPGCLYFLISTSNSLYLVLFIKVIIPVLAIMFGVFGPGMKIILMQRQKPNLLNI